MSILLCDVGGTHIRFAMGGDTYAPLKTKIDKYKTLQDAIEFYLQSQSELPENIRAFYLAFSYRNKWDSNIGVIQPFLPNAQIKKINDFEANAHGLIKSELADFVLLNKPEQRDVPFATKVVMGVGTGLGLAYVYQDHQKTMVQRSHGGHMLPGYSPQHEDLYKFILAEKDGVLIYEDILSGRGLFNIYRYLSHINHLDIEYPDIEILMQDGKDNPVFMQALDIFFEVLGLFAHHAVAFGYSYQGIYLTGGIIDRLMIAGLFRANKFIENFHQENVPIVKWDVASTPVYWVKDEFISLKGLLNLAKEDGFHA